MDFSPCAKYWTLQDPCPQVLRQIGHHTRQATSCVMKPNLWAQGFFLVFFVYIYMYICKYTYVIYIMLIYTIYTHVHVYMITI